MSVAEWLRCLTSNHLTITAVGSNPDKDIAFFHVKKLFCKLTERLWFYPGARSAVPLIAEIHTKDILRNILRMY
jgi:hypothetical protein